MSRESVGKFDQSCKKYLLNGRDFDWGGRVHKILTYTSLIVIPNFRIIGQCVWP